ncbi:MAG: transcription termination/antitermination NusG family protein [Pseudomonadota bacterium]
MKQWYVVHTHVNKEQIALENLERQNFHSYYPVYKKQRKHARKVETVRAPLFPRYLFVEFDPETDRWLSIQSTIGVSHLICHGIHPTPVPAEIIEAIQQREIEPGLIELTPPALKPGQKLLITKGPFEGYQALFESASDNQRITILLSYMNQHLKVKTSRTAVEVVD